MNVGPADRRSRAGRDGGRAAGSASDVVVGVAAAVLVFVAVPAVLAIGARNPLPGHWTRATVVSWHGAFDLLTLVAWTAWAACAWSLVRSVTRRVRAREAASGSRLLDRLSLRIALAVVSIAPGLVLAASAGSAPAGAATAPAVAPARTSTRPSSAPAPFRPRPRDERPAGLRPARPSATQDEGGVHLVRRGETVVDVAVAHFDDPAAWRAVARANLGRVMGDGTRFVDPSRVEPGWLLTLPRLGRPGDLASRSSRTPVVPDTIASFAAPRGAAIPELAGLGVGGLLAALMARRARRAQRLRAFLREERAGHAEPSERAADAASALAAFEGVPLPGRVELALRHLSASVSAADGPFPRITWVRAGNDAVELGIACPAPRVPDAWSSTARGSIRLPMVVDAATLGRAARDSEPWCPILLPLGDNERGSWLLPLTSGMTLAVVGTSSASLLEAMCAGAQGWTWHEHLVVTGDPRVAEAAGRTVGERRPDGSAPGRTLFVGDPRLLVPEVRSAVACLTRLPLNSADLTVLVDARAATVHPLGITVQPHLLDEPLTGALREIGVLEPDPESGATPPLGARVPVAATGEASATSGAPRTRTPSPATSRPLLHRTGAISVRTPWSTVAHDHATTTRTDPGPPRAPEVRLLAPVPDVAGLDQPLPSKRARRSIELIAYLAMHSPEPVTGDRLRTRVLGSSDVDAAAKTLFNVVGAARRALGTGPDGEPLLPPAAGGRYRLSPLVEVDARRLERLLASGLATSDPGRAFDVLHEGLGLVRGEPLGGVLSGYAWWRAEGHERRVADAVVDAACTLVRLSVGRERLDIARWAIDQARLVEPYSEALTRAAMELAAARGDAWRLRDEWTECLRQADEVDPGGWPSAPTEQLYLRLKDELASASQHPTGQRRPTTTETQAFA